MLQGAREMLSVTGIGFIGGQVFLYMEISGNMNLAMELI
jgi:hypothetical protein